VQSIDVISLQKKLQENEDLLLIDVRELWEHEVFNIGGLHIPMSDVLKHLDIIPKNKTVVFYCQKGIRSGLIIQRLQQKYAYANLVNLSGGMDSWMKTFH
jgi:rhodanese-related sulfurtransferase